MACRGDVLDRIAQHRLPTDTCDRFRRRLGRRGPSRLISRVPRATASGCKFTLQSKNDLYLCFEQAIFRDEGESLRFSYPADHPLASEFEEQMVQLIREYRGDGEYLSVHHPEEQGAKDDAPDSMALALFSAAGGGLARFPSVAALL